MSAGYLIPMPPEIVALLPKAPAVPKPSAPTVTEHVWDGRPTDPEQSGWHWVDRPNAEIYRRLAPIFWIAGLEKWVPLDGNRIFYTDDVTDWLYRGPVEPPRDLS